MFVLNILLPQLPAFATHSHAAFASTASTPFKISGSATARNLRVPWVPAMDSASGK